MKTITSLLFLLMLLLGSKTNACTSYLVTKGASVDGSNMISYAGDSHIRYGQLYFHPRAQWPDGSMQTIFDRSSNKPLGQIPYPAETYQVIGFMNEHQVSIGESTFGGRKELRDTTGIIDWGSIMFLGLQRAKTAREAIKVMVELVDEFGYFSSGESYSIADANEVWILELISKGMDLKTDRKTKKLYNANKGAVWVARRIPDGYISAHANQARITTFPKADGVKSISSAHLDQIFNPEIEVVYAHDVISFAKQKGYYKGNGSNFSFSDAYAPLDFGAARFCELRVWAMFDQVNDDMKQYWDYATGKTKEPRMPLWVKPNRKLKPRDLMAFFGNHLQGTELDISKDAGAGQQGLPYRWRPLTWQYEGKTYFNERTTATQQTAFSWVAQMRDWLPNAIGGIFWYGLDDANLSLHVPFYTGMTHVPHSHAEGNGDILTYSETSAFWAFQRVSHFVYLFYDRAIEDIRLKQKEYGDKFEASIPAIDVAAKMLYDKNPELAAEFLTTFSHSAASNVVDDWKKLSNFLLVKYLDGNVKHEKGGKFIDNGWDYPIDPGHPNYSDQWKKIIIEDTEDKLLMPEIN
ncbi:dipeptidase [Carboxylicivirga sp. N1Y90]|uniref:dipeptidase n=1 Tax=Carboxylicivirga fragile TaxID=3417571 RepID=UPI003D32EAE3|nr:C69 family dipeptidase [Marinilabiliaceae bacterium N1Y90]